MSKKRDKNHPKVTKAQLKARAARKAKKNALKKQTQTKFRFFTIQFAEDVWVKRGTALKDWEFTQDVKEAEAMPNRRLAAMVLATGAKKSSDPFNPNLKRALKWLNEHGYQGEKLNGFPRLGKYILDLTNKELDALPTSGSDNNGSTEPTPAEAADTDSTGEGEGTPHSPESDDAGREHPSEGVS